MVETVPDGTLGLKVCQKFFSKKISNDREAQLVPCHCLMPLAGTTACLMCSSVHPRFISEQANSKSVAHTLHSLNIHCQTSHIQKVLEALQTWHWHSCRVKLADENNPLGRLSLSEGVPFQETHPHSRWISIIVDVGICGFPALHPPKLTGAGLCSGLETLLSPAESTCGQCRPQNELYKQRKSKKVTSGFAFICL